MILKLSSKNFGNNILLTRSLIRKPCLKIEQEKIITFYERADFIKSLRALQKRFNFPYLIAVVSNI